MNATVTPHQQVAVALPGDPMQLMALAKDLANARLIPTHFQKSPADCWLVLSFCRSRGLDFFMVVGECSVVKGRLFFSGKLTAALLNTSGYLSERLSYEYVAGQNDKLGNEDIDGRSVIVRARIQGEITHRIVQVFVSEVKTGNEHWTKSPDQMLAYAGARIWGRRHMPEVLMGLMFEGEADMIDVTPGADTATRHTPPLTAESLPPSKIAAPKEEPAPVPYRIELRNGENWGSWGNTLVAAVRSVPDAETIELICTANANNLALLLREEPDKHDKLMAIIENEKAKLNEAGT